MTEPAQIMIIDDTQELRQAHARVLRTAGYTVSEAGSGQEGLDAVRLKHPDLVLLDVVLPDLDGLQVCKLIKADPDLADVFVVLISSLRTSSEQQADGLAMAEADGYISRPVSNRELLARVQTFLRIKLAEDSLRQQAQETFKESEEKFRGLIDQSTDGIAITDEEGILTTWNQRMETITSIPPGEVIGEYIWDVQFRLFPEERQTPQEFENLKKVVQAYLRTGESPWDGLILDREYKRPDGSTIYTEGNIYAVGTRQGFILVSQARDLTKQRLATQAIRDSEARFRGIIENSQSGYFFVDRDGSYQAVNDAWLKMHKYPSADEVLGEHFSITQVEIDIPQAQEHVHGLLDGQPIPSGEFTRLCKDGSIGYHSFSAAPVMEGGTVIGLEGFLTDVTERRQAQAALAAARDFTDKVIQTANVIFVQLDLLGNVIKINPTAEEITGYSQAEVEGKNWFETLVPKQEYPDVWEEFTRLAQEGELAEYFENPIRTKTGEERQIIWKNSILNDAGGDPLGTISFGVDITERIQVERALQQSKTEWETTFDAISDWVSLVDVDTRQIKRSNRVGTQFTQIPIEAIAGKVCCHLVHGSGGQVPGCPIPRMLQSRQRESGEFHIPDGDRWFMVTADPVFSESGEITSAVHIVRDITERVTSQALLQRKVDELAALQATLLEVTQPNPLTTLLHTIVERATQLLHSKGGGLYLCDSEKKELRCLVSFNTTKDFTGMVLKYGQGAAGHVAQTGKAQIIADYRTWEGHVDQFLQDPLISTLVSAPMIWQGQVTGVIHVLDKSQDRTFTEEDLELLSMFANHAAIAVENTRLYETAGAEINQRKIAQAKIKQQLVEKEILLKEVHHRVKNNLQLISSLFSLQADSSPSPEAAAALENSQNRIQTISLIHEHLYQTADLAQVDLPVYIQELVQALIASNSVSPDSLAINIDPQAHSLDLDRVVNLGLIINELVSNALKHAFPNNTPAGLQIELSCDPDNLMVLWVQDNGVGLPPELDFRSTTTLGLQIVCALVDQLSGVISLDRSAGTSFKIAFPVTVQSPDREVQL